MDARRGTLVISVVVLPLVLSGCRESPGETAGAPETGPKTHSARDQLTTEVAASCASVVDYDGHGYRGNAAPVSPVEGKSLGTATQPGCQDTPEGQQPEDTAVEVAEIEGVSPELAIMIRGRDDSILVRDNVNAGRLPTELARLLRAPDCLSGGQPVEISGRWLGILGADGHTELDLDPPYDVRIKVAETSFAAYERAELTVRVPATLGSPLNRKDIRSSLWAGGTLTATISCRDGDFVATAITVAPPG